MDDTQRLRIFRPDEDELVISPSTDREPRSQESRDLTERPHFVASNNGISQISDDQLNPSSEYDMSAEQMLEAPGILTQASGLFRRFMLFTGYCLGICLLTGCTAFHPLHGIPVRQLPREFRGGSRANMETIDLSRLSQTPLPAHIVDSGDLLGIYIYGILGKIDETPPVYVPQNGDGNPTIGLPIPVRDDGTISLPQIPPIYVRGMTVRQVEETVRREYVQRRIREDGSDILVSLQRARSYKVTVLRQETPNPMLTGLAGGGISLGATKRGTGQIVILPAGENDVLRALTLSGGLPGLDAQNAIYVLRRPRPVRQTPLAAVQDQLGKWNSVTKRDVPVVLTSSKQSAHSFLPLLAHGKLNHKTNWKLVGHSLPETDYYGESQPDEYIQLEGRSGGNAQWNRQLPDVSTGGNYGSGHGAPAPLQFTQNSLDPELESEQLPGPPDLAPSNRGLTNPRGGRGPGLQPLPQDDFDTEAPEQIPIVADGNRHVPEELQPYLMTGGQVFRIPVRLRPGEEAYFGEKDILLYDGDIIFIESRETEIFYTGGLLGGGQYSLPRDYDLDVVDAISIAQGGTGGGAGGGGTGTRIGGIASVNQDISVSASRLIVIRRMADGRRVNIKVDINKALRDENENLLIQPGDHLILRYTPIESVAAFIERNLLAGSLIGLASQTTTLGAGN